MAGISRTGMQFGTVILPIPPWVKFRIVSGSSSHFVKFWSKCTFRLDQILNLKKKKKKKKKLQTQVATMSLAAILLLFSISSSLLHFFFFFFASH